MKQGCVQIYYGTGKGKTTAAVGQGLRAAGRGLKVFMVQFMKTPDSGEVKAIQRLEPDFKVFHFEKERGFFWTLNEEEQKELRQDILNALQFVKKVLSAHQCDVLILDEILATLEVGLITRAQLVEILEERPEEMELILTGRMLPGEIANYADYITEMQQIRHPYEKGIPARLGIEY
jgi:cob(I)alamin adenosyltransferase